MNYWTKKPPNRAGDYWAVFKKGEFPPSIFEIVQLYHDGQWRVIRFGLAEVFTLENFSYWSSNPISIPEFSEELEKQ